MTGVLESPPGAVVALDGRAAESFYVLSEVSRVLADGHGRGCELKYTISPTEIRIALRPPAEKGQVETPPDGALK